MWIVDDVGEERASFRMSFRELRRLASVQQLALVAKQVQQLQKNKAAKNGGNAQAAFKDADKTPGRCKDSLKWGLTLTRTTRTGTSDAENQRSYIAVAP